MKKRAADKEIKKSSRKEMKNEKIKFNKKQKDQSYNEEWEEPKILNSFSSGKWYEEFPHYDHSEPNEVKFAEVQNLKKQAATIFSETSLVNNSRIPKTLTPSDYAWVKTVMSKGTKSDKVAAYTLLIQDSPIYNLNLLKNMVEMVKIGKNKECFMAVDTLTELFISELLPPNRKLKSFEEQPLSKLDEITSKNIASKKRRLLLWYFEDQLKSTYEDFVNYLNKIAHNSVDANKEKVIAVMCKLLEGHPEKENLLLNNIVNKLGDPSHKVGSKVIYALTKLLEVHPNMREVVIDAVEKVIFRSNISKRTQYYSVCFLSQFCFVTGEGKIAKKLILIYLALFKASIKTGDIDSRMMGALLSGVNRAYPFAKEELGMLNDHINTMYKVIHLSHANIAIQALSLVFLISDNSNAYIDRFYSVLYKKIAELEMFQSSHHAMFLSLIFKALRKDKEKSRVTAFIKRLLQMCMYIPVPVACGTLIMISEVMKYKKNALIRESVIEVNDLIKMEIDSDNSEEHYEDAKEECASTEPPKNEESKKQEASVQNTQQIKPVENLKVWSNPDKSVGSIKDLQVRNYDPFVRNPLYSGADKCLAYELFKLSKHFHPTISLFANKIINDEKIIYSGDPLLDFTLIRFLDKFSFKNPKPVKSDEEKNLTFSKFSRKKYYSSATIRRLRANTADYLNHSEKNIPVDESFLYKYMKTKTKDEPKGKTDEDASDVESVNSDDFDEMLSGLADGGKDDINFLSEVGQLPKKVRSKKKDEESESELDMEPEDEGESSDDKEDSDDGFSVEDFEGDEVDDFEDDDEMEGSDLDEDELEANFKGLKLPKLPYVKDGKDKLKKKNKYKNNLFASAEEFSELLEDVDQNAGGSEALSNKDRAGPKQLKWESERDKWIHKKNYRSKGVKRPFLKNKKPINQKTNRKKNYK